MTKHDLYNLWFCINYTELHSYPMFSKWELLLLNHMYLRHRLVKVNISFIPSTGQKENARQYGFFYCRFVIRELTRHILYKHIAIAQNLHTTAGISDHDWRSYHILWYHTHQKQERNKAIYNYQIFRLE